MTRGRSVLTGLLTALVALGAVWLVQARSGPVATDQPAQQPASQQPASPAATAETTEPAEGLPVVEYAELPPEARHTIALIDAGGPFPYEQDHDVFGNRELLLPTRPDGYYREYTVETPGSDDRGARRIVAGAGGELYYTDDHYDSFARVRR